MLHEIAEAMTDANGYGGWRFTDAPGNSMVTYGGECADVCIGQFGDTLTVPNPMPCQTCSAHDNQYNIVLNDRYYLV